MNTDLIKIVNEFIPACTTLAAQGDLNTLIWLHDTTGVECPARAMERAAMNGHLHVVRWLYETGFSGAFGALENAIAMNHVAIVNYLLDRIDVFNIDELAELAEECEHYDLADQLLGFR